MQKYNTPGFLGRLPWGLLENFLVAAEAGSIRLASERLGVNHSTVSRQLTTLEEHLGKPVFDRFSHGLELNSFGHGLLEHVKTMDSGFDALTMYLNSVGDEVSGAVHITLGDSLLPSALPAIGTLQREHPSLEVQFSVSNTLARMEKGEADIALRITQTPPDHLVGHQLAYLQVANYASKTLCATVDSPDENHYPWVIWDLDVSMGEARNFDERYAGKHIACRVDSSTAMLGAVKAGLGAGMMLCLFADREPDLVRLQPPMQTQAIPLWLLYHPQLRTSAKVQAVVAALKGAFKEG
ncbi:HTH-type transcriptional regulator PerR [BD1-7 clade bacterium]|uniref:HTH-type transcriptional regulator PerR n=1 Tax=BD1-7 clade bacterium TaxID=2029982 RepID=A0A5S9PTH8_9GAMM|nr:HTH-type transcriptional regulator PerR [BD1-7 clade bacterium]